jgi:hypothetical protein
MPATNKRRDSWRTGFLFDLVVALGLFIHWIVVGLIIDEANLDWHKGASLYLAVVTLGVNAATLARSFSILGAALPQETHSETVVGMFLEVCSLAQGWGCAFLAAREWSLPSTDPFFSDPFLHKTANSIFEMSLVQAGVGWAAAAPYTLAERAVAWCTAYIGGIFVMQMYVISVVLARRGWWHAVPYTSATIN